MLVFLLGLWLVPNALFSVLSLPLYADSFSTFMADPVPPSALTYFNSSVVLALGNLLFVASFLAAPNWWAGLIFSGNRNVELSRLSEDVLQNVLYSSIGLLLTVLAITDTPEVLVQWIFEPPTTDLDLRRGQILLHLPGRASLIIQYLIGGWLLFGTNGIVNFIRRFRAAGKDRGAT
jgi:hypothetical protein